MPLTPFPDMFHRFYSALEALGVEYFAYGGVAVGVWGDPRETQDVDAVVILGDDERRRTLDALGERGFEIRPAAARTFPIDGWLRAGFGGRFADLALGSTPFDQSAMRRRAAVEVFGLSIQVVSPEDLVLYKLIAYRRKDLADVEAVLTRQRRRLDLSYLRSWADEIAARTGKFEVPSALDSMLKEVGPA